MRRTSSTGWPLPEAAGDAGGSDPLRSTTRFTSRADAYAGSRPDYPTAFFDLLTARLNLKPGHTVVDVGSGTGILTAQLLDRGYRVVAVEPNAEMRRRAESKLEGNPRFLSVPGTAESTGLPSELAHAAVAGQSFHWFDPARAATELGRILRPDGWAVVVWNLPAPAGRSFTDAYVRFLLEWGLDYEAVESRHANPSLLSAFFRRGNFEEHRLAHAQCLDRPGWAGRIDSSSYMPAPGHARYAGMVRAREDLFDRHQEDGTIKIVYETRVFWGKL